MSISRRIAFGASAMWFSRAVNVVLGLVLLPVLFRHLPKEELGVWMVLGQSWAALGIFDLGLAATLIRRIAFAKGKSGDDPGAPLTEETKAEIADLVFIGNRAYHVLAVFAFVVSFAAGFYYFRTLHLSTVPISRVWLAWGIICLSQAIGVWANVWNSVLIGIGYVGWDSIIIAFTGIVMMTLQIIAVLMGGGLVTLAFIAAAGALAQRLLVRRFAKMRRPEIFSISGRWNSRTMWDMIPLSLRAWGTSLGAALILYTDQILIASCREVSAVPSYRAAFVLVHNVTVVATTVGIASGVFISHLWESKNLTQVHRIVKRNVRLGLIIMLTAAAFLLVEGQNVFTLWLGKGNFIGYKVLAAFLLTETLETQSYIISTSSRATEDEAFAFVSLGGGILKLVLSWILAQWLGLFGIVLGTVFGLLLTTHWYMVLRGLRRLRVSLRQYVLTTAAPSFAFFLLLWAFLAVLFHLAAGLPPILNLIGMFLITLPFFALVLWGFVLDSDERTDALQLLKFRLKPTHPR